MAMFWRIFKRRFFCRYAWIAIGLGTLLIVGTYLIRAYADIGYYFKVKETLFAPLLHYDVFLSDAAVARHNASALLDLQSQFLSFYAVMEYSFFFYTFIGNLLVTIPVLRFFYERRSGFHRFQLIRHQHYWRYTLKEGVACALAGYLVALPPCLLIWAVADLVCPFPFPLSQSFPPNELAILAPLYHGNTVELSYLLQILICSPVFFFHTLLAFVVALYVQKAVWVLFTPLAFSLAQQILSMLFFPVLDNEFPVIDPHLTTAYAPLFIGWMCCLLAAMAVIVAATRKERMRYD